MRDRLLVEVGSNSWRRPSFDATGVCVQNEIGFVCWLGLRPNIVISRSCSESIGFFHVLLLA